MHVCSPCWPDSGPEPKGTPDNAEPTNDTANYGHPVGNRPSAHQMRFTNGPLIKGLDPRLYFYSTRNHGLIGGRFFPIKSWVRLQEVGDPRGSSGEPNGG